MRRPAALLLSSLVAACGSTAEIAESDGEIQGGKPDSGDPAVGLLWMQSGGFCTGTLIAPQVVLTAPHCVNETVATFYTGRGSASPTTSEPTNIAPHAVDRQP